MHIDRSTSQRLTSRSAAHALVAVATASVGAVPVHGQCQYSVQPTPPWECGFGAPRIYTGSGLNNLGAWCGYRLMCFLKEGEGHFAIYCPPGGIPQVLPMPPGAGPWGARATGVNDLGVVVGYFSPGEVGTPMIGCIWWPDGTITVIPPKPGESFSRAEAISNSNVVVGLGDWGPLIWNDGGVASIPAPGGAARAISEAGIVVGDFWTAEGGRGFQYHNGVVVTLEPLEGYLGSGAFDVNSAGVIVGYSQSDLGVGQGFASMPTMWIDSSAVALPLPAGYVRGSARAINDSGVIAGDARTAFSGGTIARILWIDQMPYLVADLVESGSPPIGDLRQINNGGQLLVSGGASLLTPVGQSFADLNGDCAVDGADLILVLTEWGPREASVADLDGSGAVDGADLAMVLGNWTGTR